MGAVDRLLARVARIEPDADGCRIWDGAVDKDGYGVTTLREGGRRIPGTQRVHRRVLSVKVGRTLEPCEMACHTCDTPRCVEAEHLWVGTARDNCRDAIRKGRIDPYERGRRMQATIAANQSQVRGDQHGRRKLCEAEVLVIRALLAEGRLGSEIAAEFGVCRPTISNIKTRKHWTHI